MDLEAGIVRSPNKKMENCNVDPAQPGSRCGRVLRGGGPGPDHRRRHPRPGRL